MSERTFQGELVASLKAMGLCVIPIPDCGRATVEHVYDMGILFQGHYFAVENKQVTSSSWSFSSRKLSDGQRHNLQLTADHGGIPLVCVNFRLQPSAAKLKRGWPKRIDRTYFVPYVELLIHESNGQTTFPPDWCAEHAYEVLRYKSPRRVGEQKEVRWDVRFALLDIIKQTDQFANLTLRTDEYYEPR